MKIVIKDMCMKMNINNREDLTMHCILQHGLQMVLQDRNDITNEDYFKDMADAIGMMTSKDFRPNLAIMHPSAYEAIKKELNIT
jgi:hypothetical protein